jgi:hypothetical protein
VHAFLTSALDRGEWSASHPGRFNSGDWYPLDRNEPGWLSGLAVGYGLDNRGVEFW